MDATLYSVIVLQRGLLPQRGMHPETLHVHNNENNRSTGLQQRASVQAARRGLLLPRARRQQDHEEQALHHTNEESIKSCINKEQNFCPFSCIKVDAFVEPDDT